MDIRSRARVWLALACCALSWPALAQTPSGSQKLLLDAIDLGADSLRNLAAPKDQQKAPPATKQASPGKTCVKVDASTLAVAPFKGSTGIVSPPGILIVGGFGTDEAAPARVLEIMRAYGVDQVCYPGNRARPVLHAR
jgi:hypothetical protein